MIYAAKSLTAALMAAAAAPLAQAGESAPTVQVIALDDVDLARADDVAALRRDIRAASHRVCRSRGRDIEALNAERRCREAAEKRALAQLDRFVAEARREAVVVAAASP
jgi:UrcA family protein